MSIKSFKTILILGGIILMFNFFSNLFAQGGDSKQLQTVVNDSAFLVDVRTPGEFAEGSAKGAVNIPLDQVQNQLAKFKNKKHIVVFCRSGSRSSQAKAILEKNGFANVVNGGTWQNVNSLVK
jgi:phage shock protein E